LAWVNRQREEPDVQWKAAAFARWHEPDDARVSIEIHLLWPLDTDRDLHIKLGLIDLQRTKERKRAVM
jgi:hypothetical protein